MKFWNFWRRWRRTWRRRQLNRKM